MTNPLSDENDLIRLEEGNVYKIAAVQLSPVFLSVEASLKKAGMMCESLDADLIVFPELVTSGYAFRSKDDVAAVAEPFPNGKSFRYMRDLSARHNASVVYGFPESDGDKYYNSAALVNPDGSHYLYRKTHLFYREKLFFSPGDTGLIVCPAKNKVPVGLMICFDWQFPEAARVLALNGAEIICHPSNLVLPWCQQAMLTRSLENRVFSITANRIGTEVIGSTSINFTGQSQITSPLGEIIQRLSPNLEEIAVAEINPEAARDKTVTEMNNLFGDRRPAFYTDILNPRQRQT